MAILWGPGLIMLYNDAYAVIAGAKHPRAIGRPASESFAEIWEGIRDVLQGIMSTGAAVALDDMQFILERHGFPEETYINAGISAIRDDAGSIGGIFISEAESTRRVLAERRIATLSALAAEHAATTAPMACDRALTALATNPSDVPFALLYLLNDDGTTARLVGSVGLERVKDGTQRDAICPAIAPLFAPDAENATGWPLAPALRGREVIEIAVDDLETRFGAYALPGGPWPESPRMALVLPLASPTQHLPTGCLILGASPRLPFDDAYREFFRLAAGQIASAIANAQAHEAERARAESLAALDRAKIAFFSNVSHEFRTPLTLLLGPIQESLNDQHEPLPPAQRERLEIVQRNAQRLFKLVNTLLDFARIEAGRIQARYQPTDLAAYTAELASVFRSAVESAGLRLVVDCPPLPAEAAPIYVDRAMWEKIVLNLLSNAFKFTFAGEIVVSLRYQPEKRVVELRVRDTGEGIAPGDLPHLFERFHRVEGVRARTHEGAGIGLAMVDELAHSHGGDIRAESELGTGAEFIITIPTGAAHLPADRVQTAAMEGDESAAVATRAAPFVEEALAWLPDTSGEAPAESETWAARELDGAATTQDADHISAPFPGARILLVEDNADMRAYLRRLLAGQGWKVETAADGVAALAAARAHRPDLLLADVMLPEMDGFALVRAVRDDPRLAGTPVVLLTARGGEESVVVGLEAGADDYLTKPFSARELLASVRAHLGLGRLRRQIIAAQAREQGLRASNERMEEFMGRASHELRTPLTGVKANIDLLARRLEAAERAHASDDSPAPPSRELLFVTRAEQQLRRLTRLVDDLVDDTLVQSGEIQLRRDPVNLAGVVRNAVAEQRLAYPGRIITLDIPASAANAVVLADADRIAQVVANYLANALTYSNESQPVAVAVSLEPHADRVRVSVRDEGGGIASADQPRIWRRFERIEGQRHRSGSHIGLGLGLYIGKTIIERHSGSVGVTSAPGSGRALWFALPLVTEQRA
jgi:signal transduction histidine kinase